MTDEAQAPEQTVEPPIPQAARQRVLRLLHHDDWCDYGRGGSGCACSAGQALIDLIAIEREAAAVDAPALDVERLARALAYADRTDDDPSRWYSGEVGYMDYEDHARAVLAGLSQPSPDEPTR